MTRQAVTEQIGAAISEDVATKHDVKQLEMRMEQLELRMTIKLYAAVAAGVGLVKALDFLMG